MLKRKKEEEHIQLVIRDGRPVQSMRCTSTACDGPCGSSRVKKVSMRLGEKLKVMCTYQHGGNLLENIDGLRRRGVFVWLVWLGHGERLIWTAVVESLREAWSLFGCLGGMDRWVVGLDALMAGSFSGVGARSLRLARERIPTTAYH